MGESLISWMARVAGSFERKVAIVIGGFAILVSGSVVHGDDAKKEDKKTTSGRILVWAFELKTEGPREEQGMQGIKILTVDPETGESAKLATPERLGGSLSPDCRYLASNRDRAGAPNEGIWVHDLTGTSPPRKLYDRFGFTHWLNNGEQAIVVDPIPQRRYMTYRVKIDGTETTRLPIPETDCVEDCTRDGLWIVARDRTEEDRTRIHVMHPDGTARRTIVDEMNMPNADFRLSPDGKKLAYVKITLEGTTATCAVWVLDIEEKEQKQVPIHFEPGDLVNLRWSPDGRRFALGFREQVALRKRPADLADDRIVVVDVDGSNMRKLPLPPSKLLLSDWK
jgi:hypothetical protein